MSGFRARRERLKAKRVPATGAPQVLGAQQAVLVVQPVALAAPAAQPQEPVAQGQVAHRVARAAMGEAGVTQARVVQGARLPSS
jgi:L,D-peptidoglycan transpeptidase YkuD (ErfK/YbiS/YcfS/YnhG family)